VNTYSSKGGQGVVVRECCAKGRRTTRKTEKRKSPHTKGGLFFCTLRHRDGTNGGDCIRDTVVKQNARKDNRGTVMRDRHEMVTWYDHKQTKQAGDRIASRKRTNAPGVTGSIKVNKRVKKGCGSTTATDTRNGLRVSSRTRERQ